ncbi:MAG: tandem-95 repeat protein [Candidatus Competibacteraceae bacterium]|nr:tandem-95 repeat protein [Candidatus Competibacteraceae bacterium]
MSEDSDPLPFSLNVSATDPDEAAANMQWSILVPALSGTASVQTSVGANTNILYTPNLNHNGGDTFTVRCTDSSGRTDDVIVNVTINPVADAPVITGAAVRNVTMSEDSNPTAFALSLNATDVDSTPPQLAWTNTGTAPSNGSVSFSPTSGSGTTVSYTPNPGYFGADTFTVQVEDQDDLVDTVTVNVTVEQQDAPVITEGDGPIVVNMDENGAPTPFALTLNATDRETAAVFLGWSISTPPLQGNATLQSNAPGQIAVSYEPNFLYNGTDSMVLSVGDLTGRTDTVLININIADQPDAPIIVEGPTATVNIDEDNSPTAFSLTLNAGDTDTPDGDLTWSISTVATNGTATVDTTTGATTGITYTPNANYFGADSFVVQVEDPEAPVTPSP